MAKKCKCGTNMLEICYGFPSAEMIELAEEGRIIIGGCIIDPLKPRYKCPACGRTARDRKLSAEVARWLRKDS